MEGQEETLQLFSQVRVGCYELHVRVSGEAARQDCTAGICTMVIYDRVGIIVNKPARMMLSARLLFDFDLMPFLLQHPCEECRRRTQTRLHTVHGRRYFSYPP